MKILLKTTVIFLLVFLQPIPVCAHPAFNVSRAIAALHKGDLDKAEAELQQARFASPDDPVIAYNLGVTSYRKRDYEAAAGHFARSSAAKEPSIRFNSLYNLGNAAFRAGDYAAAVGAYSGSLAIKKDAQAEYNLKVAEEKLKQQQQQQQQQQNGDSSEQPKDPQQQKQEPSQQKDQQQGDQQQKDQQSGQSQKDDQSEGQGNEQKSPSDQQKNDEQSGEEQNAGDDQNKPTADSQKQQGNEQNASQTQQLNEQGSNDQQEQRQDVQMGENSKPEDEPEASQRARALKNTRVNPYMVEKVLKEMERREREAQVYYRNEPQRSDEADPFEMDAEQLRDWFEQRRRPQKQATDEPDW